MSYNTFPMSAISTILYPKDVWTDPDVVTHFDDQVSVEVQPAGAAGFWGDLHVVIEATGSNADTIFEFLRDQRLRAIPFYFVHRKRGTILVHYWPLDDPPSLPMPRLVAGNGDRVQFDLPLRQAGGT